MSGAVYQSAWPEWVSAVAFLGLFVLLTGGIRVLQTRWKLHAETSRKAVHVASGLSTLSFPWLFASPWPVWMIATACVWVLTLLRHDRSGTGAVLHSVERFSVGEIAFPLAVATVFHLSLGKPLLFIIPILILTLADAAGALAGIRYGTRGYTTDEGTKSVEGSATFFLVAFLSTHVPILLFAREVGREESLLVGIILGLLVMLAEAASWRGLDNFFIPLAAYFLLDRFRQLALEDLRTNALVALALTVFALTWRSRTTLHASAAMGGTFLGFVMWSLGGWPWLAPVVLLFCSYTFVARIEGVTLATRDFQAVLRVLAGPLGALAAWRVSDNPVWLAAEWTILGGHLANVCVSRSERPPAAPHCRLRPLDFARYIVVALVLFGLPAAFILSGTFRVLHTLLAALVGITLSATLFLSTRFSKAPTPRLWLWEAGIAYLGGLAAFGILEVISRG